MANKELAREMQKVASDSYIRNRMKILHEAAHPKRYVYEPPPVMRPGDGEPLIPEPTYAMRIEYIEDIPHMDFSIPMHVGPHPKDGCHCSVCIRERIDDALYRKMFGPDLLAITRNIARGG